MMREVDELPKPLNLVVGTADREAQAAEHKGKMKALEAEHEGKIDAARHLARADWPKYVTARDLAGNVFPITQQMILREARKHGIGRKVGRTVIFGIQDCAKLYEVLPCPSDWSGVPNRQTGSSGAPSGASALKKALAHLTDHSPRKSARSGKLKFSPNQSTDVALPARSPRRR